jgi:DNA-binding MarR family transcriptional regulator
MDLEDAAGFGEVERELVVLLRRARAATAGVARDLHPDLEPAAYGLLVRIADQSAAGGTARVTELADYYGIDKAAASRQVKTLERLGFVTRDRDPNDARAFRLVPTAAGLARLEETRSARRRQLRRQLGTWESDDVRRFAALLARFNATVDLSAR